MPQTLSKNLSTILEPVATEIQELDHRLINDISPSSRALCSILQDIFQAGGKRLRPALSFLITKALGYEIDEKIYLIAEISELIHTASLVHDDIIDNSMIRRGQATANSKWDNAITVISGDFMFARAAVNLGKLGINEITALYAKVLEDLCDGEIRQVEKKFSTEADWDYYYSKTYKKTASLFEASTKAPTLAYKLEPQSIDQLANYGRLLGIAFQIMDDILDYNSDSKTLGKPAGADLKEGQITIPVLYALESPGNQDLKAKINTLANNQDDDTLVTEIIDIINNCGALDKSIHQARDFANKAIRELNDLRESPYKKALIELAEFTVDREN